MGNKFQNFVRAKALGVFILILLSEFHIKRLVKERKCRVVNNRMTFMYVVEEIFSKLLMFYICLVTTPNKKKELT